MNLSAIPRKQSVPPKMQVYPPRMQSVPPKNANCTPQECKSHPPRMQSVPPKMQIAPPKMCNAPPKGICSRYHYDTNLAPYICTLFPARFKCRDSCDLGDHVSAGICVSCDPLCEQCVGPGAANCTECRDPRSLSYHLCFVN